MASIASASSSPDGSVSNVIEKLTHELGENTVGTDSDDFEYVSIAHLWSVEGHRESSSAEPEKNPAWYQNALSYWDRIEPTVDGMLGGFGDLTERDVAGSNEFLQHIWKIRPTLGKTCAVDCGAGIGRVTKHLLLPLFETVHVLEQSPPLLAQAHNYIGPEGAARTKLFGIGMQTFEPEPRSYDVVWIQWVIGHLTDIDLVAFLLRCKKALKPGGVICVKDNTFVVRQRKGGSTEHFFVDREDSAVTRSAEYYSALFKICGLRIVLCETQEHFPEELYPNIMWAVA